MQIVIEHRSVFDYAKKLHIAHCIAADLRMGAGIAVQMQKKFGIRGQIERLWGGKPNSPGCTLTDWVFNLITKRVSSGKPTYRSMREALISMRKLIHVHGIKEIAMPKIGCGLDKLSWARVRELLEEIFEDDDLTIRVCHL